MGPTMLNLAAPSRGIGGATTTPPRWPDRQRLRPPAEPRSVFGAVKAPRRRRAGAGRGHHLDDRLGVDLLRQRPDRGGGGVRDADEGDRVARPEAAASTGPGWSPSPVASSCCLRAPSRERRRLGLDRKIVAMRPAPGAAVCSWSSSWPSGVRCSTSRSAARPSPEANIVAFAWQRPTSRCSCTLTL